MAPILSIVIPAYNAEKFIEETIHSAIVQTMKDREIIIVNDGSSDRTMDIINAYRHEPTIRVFDNVVNRGANYTYNYGILQATGTYLTFLDADDIFLPSYSEEVINQMATEDADIGFANLYTLDGDQKKETTLYGTPRDPRFAGLFGGPDKTFPHGDMKALRKLVLQGVHISPRAIYKRHLFLDYGLEDARLRITHDWLRHIKFMLNGAKCAYVPKPLGYYRFHNEGNSQKDPVANMVENAKLMEIVIRENDHLMDDEERALALAVHNQSRLKLFNTLATSNLSNAQIVQYLLEKKLNA